MPKGWGEIGDGASFLEAIHRVDLNASDWLDATWQGLSSLVPGAISLMAGVVRWESGRGGMAMDVIRGSHPAHAERARETSHLATERFVSAALESPRRVALLSELLGRRLPEPILVEILRGLGVVDFLSLKAEAGEGSGRRAMMVTAMANEAVHLSRKARETFDAYATHLGAAFRLRHSGLGAATEGVLAPNGRVLHAEGSLRDQESQQALRRAVIAIERARRKDRRTDQEALLTAWRAIYEGRWTLVESVESDGRRLLLARVNPPARHVDAVMTPREREVAALVAQGVPQKTIGYELDLSPSTVAFHIRNIARKVGASSSTDLVRVLALAAQRPT